MPVVLALPALAQVVIAAAVMLMVWAASIILLEPIKFLLRLLPVIGGDIANMVGDLGDWIAREASRQLENRVQGFTDAIDLVTGAIQSVLISATDGIVALFGAIQGLQRAAQGLQTQLQASIAAVARDVDRAIRDATRGLARIAALAADVAGIVANAIPRAIEQAAAALRSLIRGIERDLQREIDNATGAIRTAILGLLAAQLVGLQQWVGGLVGQLQRVLQEIEADLGRRIRALEHDLGHRLDGLARDLEGLQRQIGVIPLVGLVPWIQSIARDLTRITTECVMPQCRYLGPQLDALNAIQDVATIGIVTAAVAYAIQDPEGAAADLGQFMSGADDLARQMFQATTGVDV